MTRRAKIIVAIVIVLGTLGTVGTYGLDILAEKSFDEAGEAYTVENIFRDHKTPEDNARWKDTEKAYYAAGDYAKFTESAVSAISIISLVVFAISIAFALVDRGSAEPPRPTGGSEREEK
jgi:hypothetical protein